MDGRRTEDAETDGSRLMKTEKEEKEVGRKGEIGEGCRSRSPRFSLLSHKSTLAAMPHLRQTELCCPPPSPHSGHQVAGPPRHLDAKTATLPSSSWCVQKGRRR